MTVNLRSRRTRVVAPDTFRMFIATWSPDGRWLTAGTEIEFAPDRETRRAVVVRPDGTGKRYLDTGGYLFEDGAWSPNGRCVAGRATFQARGPTDPYTGSAGLGIVHARGGRPNTTGLPRPPCPLGWWGCASWLPGQGSRNEPTYMLWSANGQAFIGLRALLREEPMAPATAWPDRFDIVQWPLAKSAHGGMLIPRADLPRPSPDARLIAAYFQRLKAYAIFRRDGRLVRRIRDFGINAWAPAPR